MNTGRAGGKGDRGMKRIEIERKRDIKREIEKQEREREIDR